MDDRPMFGPLFPVRGAVRGLFLRLRFQHEGMATIHKKMSHLDKLLSLFPYQ
jgi:hypothetical protein